ncbi:Os01g0819233 [Oryza sativa Japonica Group]|uniref:Os01g0819233 protein n=1 Tax=Oryza sativa subsp. japonica TaxID=39947 RepID=A0A0P0V9Q8_ORYSJ|nr:hypothetical protein EE612_006501 [Oryza sativa]BAS74956.1 Os01g0819233 [Oryza sativa Japonica Group]
MTGKIQDLDSCFQPVSLYNNSGIGISCPFKRGFHNQLLLICNLDFHSWGTNHELFYLFFLATSCKTTRIAYDQFTVTSGYETTNRP